MSGYFWFLQQLFWLLPRRHLAEDCLLHVALGTTCRAIRFAAERHMRSCTSCSDHFGEIKRLVRALPEAAEQDFKMAFPPERLHSQRIQINRRLAQASQLIEPGRMIEFPFAGQPTQQLRLRSIVWPATVTAGGLLVGLLVGQFLPFHPTQTETASRGYESSLYQPSTPFPIGSTLDITGTIELPAPLADNTAFATAITLDEFEQVISDDELFGDLNLSLTSFQVNELESIDALTPSVRDISTTTR